MEEVTAVSKSLEDMWRRIWCKWDNSINTNVTEIKFGDVCWIHLAQDRILWQTIVNTVMNL
jgi:hypothetical protein